jgi:hypothetical protein
MKMMEHEFILITEKIESKKCKSHDEIAAIKMHNGMIQITSCCDEFKKSVERKIEYEFYLLFNKEELAL